MDQPAAARHSRRRATGQATAALLVVVGCALFSACGRKGDPLPPPSAVPAPAGDLEVLQRGDEALLEVGYPTVTIGGLAIPGLQKVEIWEAVRSVVFDDEPPEMTKAELLATGVEKVVLEGAELRSAVSGSRILTRLRLDPSRFAPPSPPDGPEDEEDEEDDVDEEEGGDEDEEVSADELAVGESTDEDDSDGATVTDQPVDAEEATEPVSEAPDATESGDDEEVDDTESEEPPVLEARDVHYLGVRFVTLDGKTSPLSNIAWVAPERPPTAPQQLSLSATADGVVLIWSSGEPETEHSGFNVYRRFASERTYGAPIAVLPPVTRSHSDRTARFGNRYVYMVTTLRKTRPTVESGPSTEREIDYGDRFAPAAVTGVAALSEPGRVRVVWQSNEERDLAGYLIERRTVAGDFERLNEEPLLGLEYRDEGLASGSEQAYRVLAVDQEGNVGPPSEVVTAVVP